MLVESISACGGALDVDFLLGGCHWRDLEDHVADL